MNKKIRPYDAYLQLSEAIQISLLSGTISIQFKCGVMWLWKNIYICIISKYGVCRGDGWKK